ncbi:DnaJ domain-containing protein [Gilbertella persicaria]|uniref:DnaJ domain-containing protein n=1 Tax=Gilbertella persicaria TaxID=101096 RepID=UPI00221EECD3|nr:DnaJ domain-containing protein [Gilbertella persicaria]KAI8098088.1 DnaJ domain-containing protein [Gilbertella persicaria]
MEINKEEALRYEAEAFLAKAEKAAAENTSAPTTPTEKPSTTSEEKPRSGKASSGQQSAEVREILACGSDYYKVLKLDKKCTEVEIKKSYRKLALKFHPDKNKTPGADEAFKLISKAFTVLSDPQKRAIHDAGGGDPERRGAGGHPGFSGFRTQSYGASPFGEEISPEDLFNMFFGGGVPMANMHRQGFSFGGSPGFSSATFVGPGFRARTFNTAHQQQQRHFQAQQRSGWSILLQILPLIVLCGYTLFAGLLTDETPIFSFQSTSVYSQPRMTSSHRVPYYVEPNAFKPYLQNHYKLSKVEQQVEVDWVRSLQQNCLHERKQQQAKLNNARGAFGFVGRNEKQYQEALNMKLAHCEELKRFGN